MDNETTKCAICGHEVDEVHVSSVECEQCKRTGCDHCVQKYGQSYDDGDYEEWMLCDDCYYGDCRDKL